MPLPTPLILQQKCYLLPGRPILVGVSGGPDSLCLAHFLSAQGYELIIAHFNHCLRPEAEEDARFVAHMAQEWGLPYIQSKADVQAYAREKHLSLETAARELRYRFLFSAAEERAAQAVAVGHTADDQIETMLLHLLRGSGLKGLIGMEYRSYLHDFSPRIPLVRPLLGTWRKEIEAYCAQHGLTPRQDASNRSTQFLRNRIRLELLPLLETYNPRLREHLLQMSELLRDEYQLISESVEKHWAEAFIEGKEGYIALDESILRTMSIPLRRHLIRRGIEELFHKPRDLPFYLLENAARFIDEDSLSTLPLDASLSIQREEGRIYILQPGASLPEHWPQLSSYPLEVPLAGKVELGNGWELSTQPVASFEEAWRGAEQNTNPYQAWMDISDLPQSLILRPPQPGERFAPLGMNGQTVKISDLFTNLKIPIRARSRWPLLCAGNEVIWVAGLRLSERVRLHPQSMKILYVSLYRL